MGQARREALRVAFDRSIKLEFHGAKVTSDAGLLPYRELDESLGLAAIAEDSLTDSRGPTHGEQAGSAYNGHFECTCYHPLFCFNQDGDLERVLLRNGSAHSADDWRLVLEPVVARYRDESIRKFVRADAAFANPHVYEFLEAEGFLYAISLPGNDILYDRIRHLLTCPVGRSPMDAARQGVSIRITAWQPPDTPSIERIRCLPISGSALESSESPKVVVGQRPFGKSRLTSAE